MYGEKAEFKWYNPATRPFSLNGLAWFDSEKIYSRLPRNAGVKYSDGVDTLAWNTSGVQVRFCAHLSKLKIKAKLYNKPSFDHMAAIGECGFDVYVSETGTPKYYASCRNSNLSDTVDSLVIDLPEPKSLNITVNLPLYCGVHDFMLGLDYNAEITPVKPYSTDKRVIFYGTSITQGGCASRPGMSFTNILSRKFDCEFINLGFSGNGKGEPELSELFTQIARPGLFVLDYDGNCDYERLKNTMPDFIKIYREVRPEVPILVISCVPFAKELINPEAVATRIKKRDLQRSFVEQFRAEGDKNIHFLDGGTLYGGDDWEETVVDGVHPTDLGFYRIAKTLEPVVRDLLFGK